MPDIPAPTFASMPASSPVLAVPPPVVHTVPRVDDTIYHSEPSKGPDFHEKMDAMNDQFLELRKELKTLRGKDLFGKSAVLAYFRMMSVLEHTPIHAFLPIL